MMSHADCEHPSTSGARAKCRRANGNYKEGDAPTKKRAKKDEEEDRYGQTPRDPEKRCMVCGVEKIILRGTDVLTNRLLFVGAKCSYYVRRSPDLMAIDE